ncbi:MAG: hypothetical protein KAU23_04110, partial [Anaerolineales bacterium]|nr:hypothetical protein [Anaerolineales bacterium]
MKIDLWNGWYSNYPETNHQVFSHPYIRVNKQKVALTMSRALRFPSRLRSMSTQDKVDEGLRPRLSQIIGTAHWSYCDPSFCHP